MHIDVTSTVTYDSVITRTGLCDVVHVQQM